MFTIHRFRPLQPPPRRLLAASPSSRALAAPTLVFANEVVGVAAFGDTVRTRTALGLAAACLTGVLLKPA